MTATYVLPPGTLDRWQPHHGSPVRISPDRFRLAEWWLNGGQRSRQKKETDSHGIIQPWRALRRSRYRSRPGRTCRVREQIETEMIGELIEHRDPTRFSTGVRWVRTQEQRWPQRFEVQVWPNTP
jgi:hypothetical protein